ncbi:MSHA biogenesis protein MshF [Vibrio furnissii]|uniref:MSHA biogenesis protein MshF n=1 Tax=Vibrio furnissii TaxID=29494 RepID=UPI0020C19D0C|nr:MSHA biogenesis protein MshF [Vibrio furnissii]
MMGAERSRLILWALVVLSLIAVLLMAWQPINRELDATAMTVANQRIIERANVYKQEWLLRGSPDEMAFDGQRLTFSPTGWVFPRQDDNIDCGRLLQWLYPDEKILNIAPIIHGENLSDGYMCYFDFYAHRSIKIILQNNRFTSSVIPST